MRIAINATSAVAGGGITYIKNLLIHLSKQNNAHQYLIITTTANKDKFFFRHSNFKFLTFRIPSINKMVRLLWEQTYLPILLRKERVDVLFSPGNLCPFLVKCTNVLMIQNIEPFNISLLGNRGFSKIIRLRALRLLTALSIKKARNVIFPSVKALMDVKRAGIRVDNAMVIYHGVNTELFRPLAEDSDAIRNIKKKYSLDRFILYVSNIQRYKNFFELARAFILLKDHIEDDIQLVLAGICLDRTYCDEIKTFIRKEGYENRIIFLNEVPYKDLPYLYSACIAFIYPSICESFGMTLVEAMACGTPVIGSEAEPVPEICAEAAFYFNPSNPQNIAEVLLRTIQDKGVLATMKRNSLLRSKYFSWENTALNTLKAFEGK